MLLNTSAGLGLSARAELVFMLLNVPAVGGLSARAQLLILLLDILTEVRLSAGAGFLSLPRCSGQHKSPSSLQSRVQQPEYDYH